MENFNIEELKIQIQEFMDNSKYNEAAEFVAEKLGIKLQVEFIEHGKHFVGDKESRDIYSCTITKGTRSYKFRFGQSISDSGFYYTKGRSKVSLDRNLLNKPKSEILLKIRWMDYDFRNNGTSDKIHFPVAPKLYDVLACLQKFDIGTFEELELKLKR